MQNASLHRLIRIAFISKFVLLYRLTNHVILLLNNIKYFHKNATSTQRSLQQQDQNVTTKAHAFAPETFALQVEIANQETLMSIRNQSAITDGI